MSRSWPRATSTSWVENSWRWKGPRLHHQHLVESERFNDTESVRVIDQGAAIGDHRIVDGVPVATQLPGYFAHASCTPAHLLGDPPTGPVGHHQTLRGDPGVVLGPRSHRTARLRAPEPALQPDQAHRTSAHGQIDQLDRTAVLHVGEHPALGAALG